MRLARKLRRLTATAAIAVAVAVAAVGHPGVAAASVVTRATVQPCEYEPDTFPRAPALAVTDATVDGSGRFHISASVAPAYQLTNAARDCQIAWTSTYQGAPTGENLSYYGQSTDANGFWSQTGGPWPAGFTNGWWTKTATLFRLSDGAVIMTVTAYICVFSTSPPPC